MQKFEANIRSWTSESSPAAAGCRTECAQEQDRGQREQNQRRNRERFSRELAESARQLLSLEQELGGQAGNFGEWLQIAYEVNEDFEVPFSDVVRDICEAFQIVEQNYGTTVAQCLYDTRSAVLPTEIKNAAKYLSCGGRTEDILALAKSGFFMEELAHDNIVRAVAYMEASGAAAGAYQAAKDDVQPGGEAPKQQFQQTMGR